MPRCDVYLEIGAKRTFACAVDWPGWCRSGPDPDAALAALLECGPRYAAVLRPARLGFAAPARLADLRVVERLKGNATTGFGAFGWKAAPSGSKAEAAAALREEVLKALEAKARGEILDRGPRGGERWPAR